MSEKVLTLGEALPLDNAAEERAVTLTARAEAAERERDEARRFLGLQHAMVASGHSHSLLRHEHQCTIDSMQGIEVREREAIARAGRAEARADAAEKKLAALVAAAAAAVYSTVAAQVFGDNGHDAAIRALDAAIAAARGEP